VSACTEYLTVMMMKAVCLSEALVFTYKSIQCQKQMITVCF
jgi:hypothetical protein